VLPPEVEDQVKINFKERNIFNILINSQDKLLVEGEPLVDYKQLEYEISKHILNYGKSPALSENPEKAVISIKTNRGTSQGAFITVLDQAKAAYYKIYSMKTGLSIKSVRSRKFTTIEDKKRLDKIRAEIPMNISIAEPSL